MNHEALKLGLEALETGWSPTYTSLDAKEMDIKAITTQKQAIAATVQELHKENPYYPATYIGEGWQDGFDGKALASTLEPYTLGYAEGKADARAIEQTHGITPPSASPNPPRSD